MIKEVTDRKEIIRLWQEAFGDSEEEIIFFLNNAKHIRCIGLFIEDKLTSMLFLVKCKLNSLSFEYIYAACTSEYYKSRGYMTKLLDFCKGQYDCLCLIPANDKLVNYYGKRGFEKSCKIENISFDESKEICEYLLEGYKLSRPEAMYYERN